MFICSRTMLYCSYCYRIRSRQKEWSGLCNQRSTFQVCYSFHACPCGTRATVLTQCICMCEALEILESSGIKLIERVEIWKFRVTVRSDQLAVAVLRCSLSSSQLVIKCKESCSSYSERVKRLQSSYSETSAMYDIAEYIYLLHIVYDLS
jgi:hypothetical protein